VAIRSLFRAFYDHVSPKTQTAPAACVSPVTSLRSFEVEPHAVDALHEAGITVVVYTLNNPRLWERAIALGVDAVVTDAPRRHAHWQPAPADA